jgi:hypothetical protein
MRSHELPESLHHRPVFHEGVADIYCLKLATLDRAQRPVMADRRRLSVRSLERRPVAVTESTADALILVPKALDLVVDQELWRQARSQVHIPITVVRASGGNFAAEDAGLNQVIDNRGGKLIDVLRPNEAGGGDSEGDNDAGGTGQARELLGRVRLVAADGCETGPHLLRQLIPERKPPKNPITLLGCGPKIVIVQPDTKNSEEQPCEWLGLREELKVGK